MTALVAALLLAAPTISVDWRHVHAGDQVIVSGTLPGGREGDSVGLETKECGLPAFRVSGGSQIDHGGWEIRLRPSVTTAFRARRGNATSKTIVVTVEPRITLVQLDERTFRVDVRARDYFLRQKVDVQYRDVRTGKWTHLVRVALERVSGRRLNGSFALVRIKAPRGTQLRAVLPQRAVGGCYTAGTSNIVRVS